jgi:hypothetical protein
MGDPNEREPCPHRIIDDVGVAFSMGAIGGTFWHAVKGARSSPKGERLYGGVAGTNPAPLLLSSSFNFFFQRSRATHADSGAALPYGADFSLHTTALLCTSGQRRTRGTPSHRASAPAPRWPSALVRSAKSPALPLPHCRRLSHACRRTQGRCHVRSIRRRVPRCHRGVEPRPAKILFAQLPDAAGALNVCNKSPYIFHLMLLFRSK